MEIIPKPKESKEPRRKQRGIGDSEENQWVGFLMA
jgi:hypothetical protein